MDLDDIKRSVNLMDFLSTRYGISCNPQGLAPCPFHPPDEQPSLHVFKGQDGLWRFHDFHDQAGGTIVDLVARMDGTDDKEACRRLLAELNDGAAQPARRPIREHVYRDAGGQPVYKKVKLGKGNFPFFHPKDGGWIPGKGDHEHIPYNLEKFVGHKRVIITEGEKDSETVMGLGLNVLATSAPTGKGYWPDSITPYFGQFEQALFLYDTGNDSDAKKHAAKLKAAFPQLNVFIGTIPGDNPREFDITDYLEKQADKESAFLDVANNAEPFQPNPAQPQDDAAITVEELAALQIPEIDWLVEPIVERFGYCLIGAQKGVGKSLFVTQLALYAASGCTPFLADDIRIAKPLNVLLVQQEVSLPGMKDRLLKMRMEKTFNLEGRFLQKTTTGSWWNLTNKEDYTKLLRLVEKYEPDILILDPLYTFYPKELNTSGDISPMMKILSDLKSNFGLGLIVVHHFSNKSDPDEIEFRSSVGRFMGHSMIANSADTTIGLDFLHPKYRQQALPLPYQNYITVEITTRHGAWPARFCLERKKDTLLFEKSSIWQVLGRCLVPGQVEDVLDANDGRMLQKDVIEALAKDARRTTVRRAIDEAIRSGKVIKEALPGKGHPMLLRLVK